MAWCQAPENVWLHTQLDEWDMASVRVHVMYEHVRRNEWYAACDDDDVASFARAYVSRHVPACLAARVCLHKKEAQREDIC